MGSPRTDLGIQRLETEGSLCSPTESARRIIADDGTWTKGDARICAEFVLAAQAEFTARVARAGEALDGGPEAVAEYLLHNTEKRP